jgi:hypothetical protein
MSEFFWFLLGALVYKVLFSLLDFGHKRIFLTKIKYLAFLLIGRAYQELLLVQELKYKAISYTLKDEQKLKLHKNSDKAFIRGWKKTAVDNLNSSVPFPYQNAIEVEDWSDLMRVMDNYYRAKLRRAAIENSQDQKDVDRS